MTSPLNLGLQDAYGRLGVKGGAMPTIDDVVPVMVVGSVADSLAAELFEARGFFGASPIRAVLSNAVGLELYAIAPGGVLIQQLYMAQRSQGGTTLAWLSIGPTSLLSTPTARSVLNVGGAPVRSTVATDVSVAAVLPSDAQELPVWTVSAGAEHQVVDLSPLRIYVPTGNYLSLILQATDTPEMGVLLGWRELSAIPGTP